MRIMQTKPSVANPGGKRKRTEEEEETGATSEQSTSETPTEPEPEPQPLPDEALKCIFSGLSAEELVVAGQVCRDWRRVARLEELWRPRELHWPTRKSMKHYTMAVCVLRAAPCLGLLTLTNQSRAREDVDVIRQQRACKIFGMRLNLSFGGRLAKAVLDLLKIHEKHLKYLKLQQISKNLEDTLQNLSLTELHLDINDLNRYPYFTLTRMKCLEKLTLQGHMQTVPLASIIKASSKSLQSITLFTEAKSLNCRYGSVSNQDHLFLEPMLECSKLREIKMPFCFTYLSPWLRVSDVTLVMVPGCQHHLAYRSCSASPPAHYPAEGGWRLRFQYRGLREEFRSAERLLKRLPLLSLLALQSVTFELTDPRARVRRDRWALTDLPELDGKVTFVRH